MNKNFLLENHFHFIGIGGIGMSAIAMALLKKGYSVSGSDLISNNEINHLKESGAIIFNSQIKENIKLLSSKLNKKIINIVVTSAIKPENQELAYCINKKLPVKHRSDILAMLMESYTSLAISGMAKHQLVHSSLLY